MIETAYAPKSGEGVWLWLIKIVTGVLLIVILGIHLVVNHFIGQMNGLMSHSEVVTYYLNPLIVFMEIVFLVFVVSHALLGLRGIIIDLRPSRSVMTAVNWGFSILGVVSIIYGSWLIQVIVGMGR